jgi:hypothetical protein
MADVSSFFDCDNSDREGANDQDNADQEDINSQKVAKPAIVENQRPTHLATSRSGALDDDAHGLIAEAVFPERKPAAAALTTKPHHLVSSAPYLTSKDQVRGVVPPPSASRHIHTERIDRRASSGYSPENLTFKDQVREWEPPRIVSARHVEVEAVASPVPAQAVAPVGEGKIPADAVLTLVKEGFPAGLAQELLQTKALFPLHLWLVDNSGSMLNSDCLRLVRAAQVGKMDMTKCNRWKELQDTVECHAHLAGILESTTNFRLLNKPVGVGQDFTVSCKSDVELAKKVMDMARPEGVTPLTQHVMEIRERISAMEQDLIANGHKAVVVIATDGLPSDIYGDSPEEARKEFCDALKALQILPVWIVIRLCTNERNVRNFYHTLDRQLELPMECISSYVYEAKEIKKWNGWLNYALPLHRCREMGYHHRVFDLLDERGLTKDELLEFLEILFGKSMFENAPDIHTEWKGFMSWMANVVSKEVLQYNPQSRKMDAWIDIRKLNLMYGGGIIESMYQGADKFVLKRITGPM